MGEKKPNLHFVEESSNRSSVAKPQRKVRGEKSTGQAKGQPPSSGSKLKSETEKAAEKAYKLRFGKADITVEERSRLTKAQRRAMYASAASSGAHKTVAQYEDDNVGVEAANQTTGAAETAGDVIRQSRYCRKLRASKRAEKLIRSGADANGKAERTKEPPDRRPSTPEERRWRAAAQDPERSSAPFSRWKQRQDIRKSYAAAGDRAAKAGQDAAKGGSATAEGLGGAAARVKELGAQAVTAVSEHAHLIVIGLACAVVLLFISGYFSSCSVLMQGGANILVTTSYTAGDREIVGANNAYKALEAELQRRVDTVRTTYPGYDEYDLQLDEINHDPYVLASYLAVLYEDYTREEVQAALQQLFEQQYELTIRPEIQIRTRVVPYVYIDPFTLLPMVGYRTEQYEYRILHVTLKNHTLEAVIANSGMTEEQKERYEVLLETRGNKPYLFGDDIYANPTGPAGTYEDYDIPAEALTDEGFANLIAEAEKYLGMEYVWGGSSPETGFDCSSFVSYVINHDGSGRDVGRQNANGLWSQSAHIPASEAKPGDIIFFQGTYDTPGASHCGIYAGNGMMIHAGNPISYTSIEKSYWQEHFLGYGRIS